MSWAGAGKGRGGRPWRRKRDAIMKRDGYLCQWCKRAGRVTEAREVDHIVDVALGGSDDQANLEAICVECHKLKTHGVPEGESPMRERKPPRVQMLRVERVQTISTSKVSS